MIFDWSLFLPIFLATIVLALKPGPYMMAFTSLAAEGRWRSMLVFWLGSVTAGTSIYFLLLGGLSTLPEKFGLIFIFIKALAAVSFVVLGLWGLSRAEMINHQAADRQKEKITKQSFFQTVSSGFLLTMSNPYDLIFIFAGIPAIVGKMDFSFADILVIRGAVISADVMMLLIYCVPILIVRNFLKDSWLIKLRYISSIAMLGIAGYIFYSIVTQWDLYQGSLL